MVNDQGEILTLAAIANEPGGLESIHEVIAELRALSYIEEARLIEDELREHGLSVPADTLWPQPGPGGSCG